MVVEKHCWTITTLMVISQTNTPKSSPVPNREKVEGYEGTLCPACSSSTEDREYLFYCIELDIF